MLPKPKVKLTIVDCKSLTATKERSLEMGIRVQGVFSICMHDIFRKGYMLRPGVAVLIIREAFRNNLLKDVVKVNLKVLITVKNYGHEHILQKSLSRSCGLKQQHKFRQ